jgi:hypothetical protein
MSLCKYDPNEFIQISKLSEQSGYTIVLTLIFSFKKLKRILKIIEIRLITFPRKFTFSIRFEDIRKWRKLNVDIKG